MKKQMVFKRYEIKFLLDRAQKAQVLEAMEPYMVPDAYGNSTIRNIYFDTENFRLIRRSLEKPVYKEKLRLRSYSLAAEDGDIFVELKKKYRGVVYKRRLILPQNEAMEALLRHEAIPGHDQITEEINYFCRFYETLRPVVFLSYDREAWHSRTGDELRVTFDENVRCRGDRLSLCEEPSGYALLPEGKVLMEVKTPGAIPLWLVHCLTEVGARKASFSKYGEAYRHMCACGMKGVCTNV